MKALLLRMVHLRQLSPEQFDLSVRPLDGAQKLMRDLRSGSFPNGVLSRVLSIYSGGARVPTLGIPGYTLWGYPGTHSGSTRVYTLRVPGYLLWGFPGINSGGTRVPGYTLWSYPGMYSGDTRVYTLGLSGNLPQ